MIQIVNGVNQKVHIIREASMPKKILVVDDEPFIIQMVTSRLTAGGYEVVSGCDGQEALQKAKSEKPDLIIMDVMMPKMDGYQACATLKQDVRFQNIPIILFTAKSGDEPSQVGIEECGADSVISKPFDAKMLLEKIAELLKGK